MCVHKIMCASVLRTVLYFLLYTVNLDFLLRVYSRHHSSKMGKRALEMSLATLKAMAKGGMHDHIGQVCSVSIIYVSSDWQFV